MFSESSSDDSVDDIPTIRVTGSDSLPVIETPRDDEEVFNDIAPQDPPAAKVDPEVPPPSEPPPADEAVEAVPELPPAAPATSQPGVFTVAWSVRPIVHQVRRLWMADSINPIFFARPIGPMAAPSTWLITERDIAAAADSPEVIAVLSRGRPSFLSRRWVLRCGDNEALGFAFYDLKPRRRTSRAFRVVLPLATPYQSASPEKDLSALARAGEVEGDFLLLCSKIPAKRPNGRIALSFGLNIIVQPSVKNFIVEDAEGTKVFVIYKASDETCTVRVMPPITPLFGFALAVAIVTTAN
jgi:hypothetical protein